MGSPIQHLAALREGVDPLAERDGGRDAVTMKDVAAHFDAEHIAVHLKPSMRKEYRRSLKKFILPFFGSRPIAEVSREEVARFHHNYRHVPYQANNWIVSRAGVVAGLAVQHGTSQPPPSAL